MKVFTKSRAWIILTSPPLTQSSSRLTPPDSESQEKPSTDDLQIYGTILCHTVSLTWLYFKLTLRKRFDANSRSAPRHFCQTFASIGVARRRLLCTPYSGTMEFIFNRWLSRIIEFRSLRPLSKPRQSPIRQSSSHLIPPGHLDQEKSSADYLHNQVTILCHRVSFVWSYFKLTWGQG